MSIRSSRSSSHLPLADSFSHSELSQFSQSSWEGWSKGVQDGLSLNPSHLEHSQDQNRESNFLNGFSHLAESSMSHGNLSSLVYLDEGMHLDTEEEDQGVGTRSRTRQSLRVSRSTLHRGSPSAPYPPTLPSSPALSRSSSFRVQLPSAFSPLHQSPFESGMISPFRQLTTSEYATMDPTQSMRSAPPSSTSTSSISGLASAFGSSSAASSVHGGDSQPLSSTPYRSSNGPRNSLSMSQRSNSPTKRSPRKTIKLTDSDRKRICEYRDANPVIKQDVIGELFGVERSTVSKILKNREKWLAMEIPDEEDAAPFWAAPIQEAPVPVIAAAVSLSRITASGSHASPRTRGGRFPDLEDALIAFLRSEIATSGPSFVLADDLLQRKAREITGDFPECFAFKASAGWLEKFKERWGIIDGAFIDTPAASSRSSPLEVHTEDVEEEERDAGATFDTRDDDFNETKPLKDVRRKTERMRRPSYLSHVPSTRRLSDVIAAPSLATIASAGMELDASSNSSNHSYNNDLESTPTHSIRGSSASMAASASRPHNVDPYANFSPQALLALSQQRSSTSANTTPGATAAPTRTSPAQASLAPLTVPNYVSATDASFFPYTFESGASTFAQDTVYPLQSPFQQGTFPPAQYITTLASTPTTSGANSPGGTFLQHQHVRSNSTASSNSGYSSLTAFSSQPSNGTGTPLTASSSYSQFSTVSSLPCTPAVSGYFGHGDGQQSQLQFAFAPDVQSASWLIPDANVALSQSQPPSSTYAPRRATISGGAPVLVSTKQVACTPPVALSEMPSGSGAFDIALTSLQNALDYLSTEGNGYVSPMDLVVLSDLKGKMVAHQKQACKQAPSLSTSSLQSRGYTLTRAASVAPRNLRAAQFGSMDYSQGLAE